ncbi:hypothetical protein Gotur_001764 [Gossypium turneri]
MVKVPFVVFLLALVLSIQFVVGQDEEAIDEEVSREADKALFTSESVDGPTSGLADEIAASPKSEVGVATESAGGPKSS